MSSKAALLVMLVLSQAGSPAGQLLGTFGSVTVQRQGELLRADSIAALESNDQIISAANSGAMVLTEPNASLYVGQQTKLTFRPAEDAQRVDLQLDVGELRVSPSNQRQANVRTPWATAVCAGPATARVQTQGDTARFWAEAGSCTITLSEAALAQQGLRDRFRLAGFRQPQTTLVLQTGESVTVREGQGFGEVEDGATQQWLIDPTEFALSIAGGGGSRLQPQTDRSIDSAPTTETFSDDFTPDNQGFNSQISLTGGINLTLGTSINSAAAGSSGGTFADANQSSLSGELQSGFGPVAAGNAFPGNIHLITGETGYSFPEIMLQANDMFPDSVEFWSIGVGASPTAQVATDIFTGTNPTPTTIRIPQFDAYIIRFDQFSTPDPASVGATPTATFGTTGLVGNMPVSPGVAGATPLRDERANINETATFALGEFAIRMDGDTPVVSMRRSDQDRRIIKDPGGNDDNDQITVNTDVSQFHTTVDNRFFAQNVGVYVPANDSLRNLPEFSRSTQLRKAAFTVLTAERLQHVARRTGQTRFVVDGSIVDITGYKP